MLLEHGADPSVRHPQLGHTALHMALTASQSEDRNAMVLPLIEALPRTGRLPDDGLGRTALMVLASNASACADGDATLLDVLMDPERALLDPTAREPSTGRTAS